MSLTTTNRQPAKKAVAYVRVSHQAQVEGTSLASQEEHARRFCAERKLELGEIFVEEGESAKTAERTQFLRALEYCRRHQHEIGYFLVYKVDRFARNTADHFEVRKRLASWGISLLSVTEPIGDSPSERFVEAVLAASAEFDNDIRKLRCMDGMATRIKDGIWPFKPPIGYDCQFHRKHGKKKTTPDPVHAVTGPIIRRALREYATGVHTQADLARLLDEWGLAAFRGEPTRHQLVERIVGKYLEFYAGNLRVPWTGEVVRGRHEPLISEETLHRIRAVRSGKGWTKPMERRHALFPLRGLLRCALCGNRMTGSVSRGRGGAYPYYHCRTAGCRMYGKGDRQERLHESFGSLLAEITPRPSFLEMLRVEVRCVWEERGLAVEDRTRALRDRRDEHEERKRRIFAAFEAGVYNETEFQERKNSVESTIAELKQEAALLPEKSIDLPVALDYAVGLVTDLRTMFSTLGVGQWSRFEKILFPAGVTFERNVGLGTPDLALIYALNREACGQKSPVVDLVRTHWNQLVDELSAIAQIAELETQRQYDPLPPVSLVLPQSHHSDSEAQALPPCPPISNHQ